MSVAEISKKAKQLRKAKPSMKWQDAIKQASALLKKKSPSAKKTAPKKIGKAVKPATKKIVAAVKKAVRKPVKVKMTIGAVSTGATASLANEQRKLSDAERHRDKLRTYLKETKDRGEKARIRTDIKKSGNLISAHKKFITALKRAI